jgi:YfiH family protein
LSHLFSSLLKQRSVAHIFPTRSGGVSTGAYESLNLGGSVGDSPESFEENMRRVSSMVGLTRETLYSVWQMHGREVVRVEASHARKEIGERNADALITNVPGVGVGVRTADCTPILLFDPVHQAVAAIHAGWRGTVLNIPEATLDAMTAAYQTNPKDIVACIGPCIGPCCFEVGAEVVARFEEQFSDPSWRGQTLPNGKSTIDLYAANELNLRRSGVSQIETIRVCTMCDPQERFFSYRRQGEKSGRHLSIIAVPPLK